MKEIPKQLKNGNVRFNLLRKKEKTPIEEWKTKNYIYNDERLINHIKNGGNYGVLCGDGLIVIDADTTELKEIVTENIPGTFTVKTSKGKHYYLYCKGFNQKKVLNKGETHLGEIQSTGTYVVGANSTHPSGEIYKVLNDVEILTVKKSFIDNVFSEYYTKITSKKNVIIDGVEKGNRNNSLFNLACSFKTKGVGFDESLTSIILINQKNKPPLSEHEIINLVKSAYNYDYDVKNLIDDDVSIISFKVIQLLLEKRKRDATELIVLSFLKKERVYTTRDDEKSECWIYKDGIYVPQARTYIIEYSRQTLGAGITTHLINEIILKIESDTYIDQDEFFKVREIWKIAVLNGVLDIKKNELEEFSPDYFFFNKIPVIYEQDNLCENIIQFLKDILKDEKELDVIQEIFGYLLLKDHRIEKAFMFTGTGRNGKGKTVELMKRFIGIENTCNIPLQSLKDDGFNIGELFNKMANIGSDITSEILKETGMFKSLTGRDLVSAQRKFLNRVKFTNYAKMIFCANELPITYDKTIAFFNRWVIIDFPYTFLPQKEIDVLPSNERQYIKLQDTNIIDNISTENEMTGLLNWALIGLHRLLEQGDFSYSPSTSQVKDIWLRKSNSLSAFVMDYVKTDYEGKIKKSDFRMYYTKYCKKHRVRPVSDKVMKRELIEVLGAFEERFRMMNLDEKMDIYYWGGIKFIDDQDDQDDHGFSTLRDFTKFS